MRRRAARTLGALVVAAAAAAGQTDRGAATLFAGREALVADRSFTFEDDPKPRLLYVRGALPAEGAAAETLRLDDGEEAPLAAFLEGPRRFAAALPVLPASKAAASRPASAPTSAPTVRTLRLRVGRAGGDGVVLERVELVPAARVLCVLRDQATKSVIKGVVQVTAVDGGTPPLCGPLGGAPREGAAWISTDGGGEIWAPLGATTTYVGRASPFRAAVRHRRRLDLADGLAATLLLPPDQRPEGSRIVEALDPARRFGPAHAAKDAALEVGLRVSDWDVVPADRALAGPDAFVAALIERPERRVVVTNELGASVVPAAIRPFVTLRLADGALIHSNGPLPLLEDLRREGTRVKAWIKLRCPEDARLEALYVRVGRLELRLPATGPTTLPLDVEAEPGAPIAFVAKGTGFDSAPPFERPFAARVVRAP